MNTDVLAALDGVDGTVLDCVFVNLAVLAHRAHGPGSYLRLGSAPRFRPRQPSGRGVAALPTIEPTQAQRLARTEEMLGLGIANRWDGVNARNLRDITAARPGELLLAVGDAIGLDWTPYHLRQSMEHSFLVGRDADSEDLWLADAYHNDTEWGSARPFCRRCSGDDLSAAIGDTVVEVTEFRTMSPASIDVRTALRASQRHFTSPDTASAVSDYITAYRSAPPPTALARLTLETWLLARERRLHARWLMAAAGAGAESLARLAEAADQHATGWTRFAEQVFIALQRTRRNRPAPPDLYDRLAALLSGDTLLARPLTLAPETPAEARSIHQTVVAVVGEVLSVDRATLLRVRTLTDLPAFSSFRIAEILERVEEALGVEVEPAALTPENLSHLDTLCSIFARTTVPGASPGG